MNNQITIKVEGKTLRLDRNLLLSESDKPEIRTNLQQVDLILPLPTWVTLQVYLLIQKFLKTKSIKFFQSFIDDHDVIVKVLRSSDYLGMNRFQDQLINDILIPQINEKNCLVFLEESHRKLKSVENAQSWFNLLNMSINYLSSNIFLIFEKTPDQLKKINEKILNEVLDRVIRSERKSSFARSHQLFQLLVQCQQSKCENISHLFRYLSNCTRNKKIYPKIHAKLSWKLENISEITEKKTKEFKFLDLKWYLFAQKKPDKGLLITLNLISLQGNDCETVSSASRYSSATQNGEKGSSLQFPGSQQNLDLVTDEFTKVVVFYSKITWKYKGQSTQKETILHYIILHEADPLPIFLFNTDLQQKIGKNKLQLTIFCNIDQIYTFSLNYVLHNYEKLSLKGIDFCREEMKSLIIGSKRIGNYSQALKITLSLFSAYPQQKQKIEYSKGYDFNAMSKICLEKYTTVFGKPYDFDNLLKMKEKTIPLPLKKDQITQNRQVFDFLKKKNQESRYSESRRSSQFQTSLNEREERNSRAESRGSKRKIFSRKSHKQIPISLSQQMMRVTDLTNYINSDVDQVLAKQIKSVLSR